MSENMNTLKPYREPVVDSFGSVREMTQAAGSSGGRGPKGVKPGKGFKGGKGKGGKR